MRQTVYYKKWLIPTRNRLHFWVKPRKGNTTIKLVFNVKCTKFRLSSRTTANFKPLHAADRMYSQCFITVCMKQTGYKVAENDISNFDKVAFSFESKTLQFFSSLCLTDMFLLCRVSFFLVHHHFASTAQYFTICSMQASWRCITLATRTLNLVINDHSQHHVVFLSWSPFEYCSWVHQ